MAQQSTRELVLARRKAMSTSGKAGLPGGATTQHSANTRPARATAATAAAQAVSAAHSAAQVNTAYATAAASNVSVARKASLERRAAMSSGGKKAIQNKDRTRTANYGGKAQDLSTAPEAVPAPQASPVTEESKGCGCDGKHEECKTYVNTATTATAVNGAATIQKAKRAISRSVGRAASLARRAATSTRGKSGVSKNGVSAAQTARAGNPNLSSRDLSRALREQRSKNGGAGQKKSRPSGRIRPNTNTDTGAAQDAPWKVGASNTIQGQIVTGTMVGRSDSVTGDEPSTCRTITGTEYLGADIFRDFCQVDPAPSTAKKVVVTTTSHGNTISGNRIGRGEKVTGNEPGTCKIVTGNEYISAEQQQGYCGEFASKSARKISMAETMKGKPVTGNNVGRSAKVTGDEPGMSRALTGTQYTRPSDIGNAPAKVGVSTTLRGGSVTGTTVGRRENMTGDEPGSCRNISGDDYVGQEQYSSFCNTTPAPQDRKVGVSSTGIGMIVTGTMTDRASKVTGNEPGSCKSVTGTPYASAEQAVNFCQAEDAAGVNMRIKQLRSTPGMVMTGQQPGIDGVMTGADKGACKAVSGTPYVGADQFADACPATPANSASPDFPQPIGGTQPWQQFSVSQPSGGAAHASSSIGITGSQYEKGHITGPFGMAPGKVTGTEEARFGGAAQAADQRPVVAEDFEGRIKARITGEGQDAGLKITGDDWDRGSNVTGTEGPSAIKRNPTMRVGLTNAMAVEHKRNEDLPLPISKVTGGSGNTEKGSLITYSGGARG